LAKKAHVPYLRGEETSFVDPMTDQPYIPNPTVSGRRIPLHVTRDGQTVPLSPYRRLRYKQMSLMTRLKADIPEPWRVAAFYSPALGSFGGVLFLDGHVSFVNESSSVWPRIRRDSSIPAGDEPKETQPPHGTAPPTDARPAARRLGFTGVAEFFLIPFPSTRQELHLTGQQTRAIDRLLQNWGQRGKSARRSSAVDRAGLTLDERTVRAGVLRILDPGQQQRLYQLALQANGGPALLRQDVVEALKLTAEQQERIRVVLEKSAVVEQSLVDQTESPASSGPQLHAALRQLPEVREQAYGKALAVLTPEQQSGWQKMIGPHWQLGALITRG
jgi:prepilin-type processing-associated H-X9-DG protein